MLDLRTAIQSYLKTKHARVYFQAAPETASFPYLVFDIPNIYDDGESTETATVDVDAWDAPSDGDTTALETLIASVNAGLNKAVFVTPDGSQGLILPWQPSIPNMRGVFYLENKMSLTDDDPRIRRRKYVYQAKLFKRG